MQDNKALLTYHNYLRSRDLFVLDKIISVYKNLHQMLQGSFTPISKSKSPAYKTIKNIISEIKNLSSLVSELTARENGIKTNDQDIRWAALMAFGAEIERVWEQESTQFEKLPDGDVKNNQIKASGVKFISLIGRVLSNDLIIFPYELKAILIKEYLRYLNSPHENVQFNSESVPSWIMNSSWMKELFFPNQTGKALIAFKQENTSALGPTDVCKFMGPVLDKKHIFAMLKVLADLNKFNPMDKHSENANLIAYRMLQEHAYSLSDFSENLGIQTKKEIFSLVDEPITDKKLNTLNELLHTLNNNLSSYTQYNKSEGQIKTANNGKIKNDEQLFSLFIDFIGPTEGAPLEGTTGHIASLLLKIDMSLFPAIETKKERAVLIRAVKSFVDETLAENSQKTQDSAAKLLIKKKRETFAALLEKKLLKNLATNPVNRKPPLKLTHSFQTAKVRAQELVVKYLEKIFESVKEIISIFGECKESDIEANTVISYALKYYMAVIDELIQALEKSALFYNYADENLLQELVSFKWNQSIEALKHWYKVSVNSDSEEAPADRSLYSLHLSNLLEGFKIRVKNNFKVDEMRHLKKHAFIDLQRLLESNKSCDVNLQNRKIFIQEQIDKAWQFLFKEPISLEMYKNSLNDDDIAKSNITVYLYLIEESKVKSKSKWQCLVKYSKTRFVKFEMLQNEIENILKPSKISTIQIKNKKYQLGDTDSKKLAIELITKAYEAYQYQSSVTIYALHQHHDNVLKAAKEYGFSITGMSRLPFEPVDQPLIFYVRSLGSDSANPSGNKDDFQRAVSKLLRSNNILVEADINNNSCVDLTKLVNGFRLFSLLKYGTPSFEDVKNYVEKHNGILDFNIVVEGRTMLHIVVERNLPFAIAKYLINEMKADVGVFDNDGNPVFHYAALKNDKDYCSSLLGMHSIEIDQKNKAGETALEVAVKNRSEKVAKYLIKHLKVAEVEKLKIAIQVNSLKLVSETLKASNTFDRNDISFMNEVMKSGSLEIFKKMKEYNFKFLPALLHTHCKSDSPNPKLIQYLIQIYKLNINALDDENNTPLHCAAKYHHVELVKKLIELGADVKRTNSNGETALHCVADIDFMDENAMQIARLLLAKGVPLNVQNKSTGTVLHLAAIHQHLELAKLLLNRDEKLLDIKSTANNYKGQTPTIIVRRNGAEDLEEFFIATREQTIRNYNSRRNNTSALMGMVGMVAGIGLLHLKNKEDNSADATKLTVIGGFALGVLSMLGGNAIYKYVKPVPLKEEDELPSPSNK